VVDGNSTRNPLVADYSEWRARDYFQTYYSDVVLPDEQAVLAYQIDVLRAARARFGRGLEYGCGPTLHRAIAAAKYVFRMDMADWLADNLAEAREWLCADDSAPDWKRFTRYVLGCEGSDPRDNARVTKRPSMGVTTLNSIGATPFLLAARTADAPLMKLLAELGADPMLTNEDGSTPLMVAAGLGTNAPGEDPGTEPEVLEAVKVALDLGNDLNAVDKNGETAMHGAAYKHVPSVVRYLAEKGAKIEVWNRPNGKGWTPLTITEGVQRGMNIVSSPPTAAVIREVMK